MAEIIYPYTIVSQEFSDNPAVFLIEALRFPDYRLLDNTTREATDSILTIQLEKLIVSSHGSDLHRQIHVGEILCWNLELVVEPPVRSRAWREAFRLNLPVLQWQQGKQLFIVYVPSLGIEILANDARELRRLTQEQVEAQLFRSGAIAGLSKLVSLSRSDRLQVFQRKMRIELPTVKQKAQELAFQVNRKSELERLATQTCRSELPRAYERDEDVARVAAVLSGQKPRSVLLVGPSGTGKTIIFQELIRRQMTLGLQDRSFWFTSGSRIVADMTGVGMWQERCEALRREAAARRAILHFGSLWELMEVGRSERQEQSIASFLRPAFARGELLGVVECTPEQLALIERRDVALLRAFQVIEIEEPSSASCLAILHQVIEARGSSDVGISAAALEQIERLHRRFATYSAAPARSLRFLHNLLADQAAQAIPEISTAVPRSVATPARMIDERDVNVAFTRETGLPLWLIDERTKLDLAATEGWFSQRVIGQPEAVSLVVNLLATIKSGLNKAGKPLASFLFIGPTGVGKTEMAKALAECIFGVRSGTRDRRLIRIDMSEYADAKASQRLIAGTFSSEGVLTSRVREQPFSVVLLDEFEKAHSSLFDLLLQVLGDGRLTDAAGRVADFRNSIIIMTSNLGTVAAGKGSLGFGADAVSSRQSHDHYTRAVRQFVRPEFFGRIDRVVSFNPIDEATAQRVVRRELQLVQEREGVRYRRLKVEFAEGVSDHLVKTGFESALGARGLKRQIERELLLPLAEQINTFPIQALLRAQCDLALNSLANAPSRSGLRVTVQTSPPDLSSTAETGLKSKSRAEIIERLINLRMLLSRMQTCPTGVQVQNELDVLAQDLARQRVQLDMESSINPASLRHDQQSRLVQKKNRQAELLAWQHRRQVTHDQTVHLEDQALLSFYLSDRQEHNIEFPIVVKEIPRMEAEAKQHLRDLYDLSLNDPRRVRILLVARQPKYLKILAEAYVEIADKESLTTRLWCYRAPPGARDTVEVMHWNLNDLHWVEMETSPGTASSVLNTSGLQSRVHQSHQKPRLQVIREQLISPSDFIRKTAWHGVLGVSLEFSGPCARGLFGTEQGLHRFIESATESATEPEAPAHEVIVYEASDRLDRDLPPYGIDRFDQNLQAPFRREFDFTDSVAWDEQIKRMCNFNGKAMQAIMDQYLQQGFDQKIASLLRIN